jgi:hypothetical protein
MFEGRNPPAAVARQLRQEAGFGCAACGCPIVEYHHIVEWHERQHFEPEHMVALCPNHHTEYGKLSRQKSYDVKQNPINVRKGKIEGFLGGNKKQKALRIGGVTVSDCESALNFSGIVNFSFALEEEEFRLNVFIPDDCFWPEVEVKKNNLIANTAEFWDIEFKTNWEKFRRKQRDIFLEIDFRGDHVEIDGAFNIGTTTISLKEKNSQINRNRPVATACLISAR